MSPSRLLYLLQRLLFLYLLCLSSLGYAQTAEVRGFVYNKKSGEPLIFTNVRIQGSTFAAKTDVNGFYLINKLPAGKHILLSNSLGFDTAKMEINLQAGQRLNQNLFLTESNVSLNTIEVTSERAENLTDVKISTTKISPRQISQIPSVGGEPDLAQYLQVLPGVVFTGDQGGQLYIRGGSAIQNKVLLDGMVIYNPFHSIGLFSVFDVDVIRNVDVYTGGFSADYGGRISSIMDITTRDGNRKKFSAKVATSPFLSRVVAEGPLNKYKEDKASISYLISAKTSYLDQSSKTFYSYIDKNGLPYSFNDLYSKLSINSPTGSKFNVFGFRFNDQVSFYSPASLDWNANGIGGNFVVVPPSSSALINGHFAYSSYQTSLQQTNAKPRSSEINGFNGGIDFDYFFGDDELKYGVELLGFRTNFQFTNASNLRILQEDFTTEIAGFMRYKYVSGKWVIEPSFRGHYYASLGDFSPEPRLGIKYIVSPSTRLKLASGLYSQNLVAATSDRDVVNLFYGFLSAPESLPAQFDGKKVKSNLQKAKHLIAGVEYDINRYITINVEGYFKTFDQLTTINNNKQYDDNASNSGIPDAQKKDFIIESGIAKGLDFVGKYERKGLYCWLVYSLGYVNRYDGTKTYFPIYDRRHTINVVTSYSWGNHRSWEANLRWNFGSGFPFTPNQGNYESIDFNSGINTNYTTSNGSMGSILGELNSHRLPYYHRLDLALKKKFSLGKKIQAELNAGATNVYNRANIFYVDRTTTERRDQLPFLPSAGLNISF